MPDDEEGEEAAEPLPSPPDSAAPPRALPLPARAEEPTTTTKLSATKRVEPETRMTVRFHRGPPEEVGHDTRTRITRVQAVKPTVHPGQKGNACLVLLYPPGPDMGKRIPLTREVVIGRGEDCDLQIDRDSVSRRHARMFESGGYWHLEDLQSTNGSYVNDTPAVKQALHDGDFVKIGSAILKFLEGSGIEAGYHEAIYKLTIVDALTEAYNQRYFLECLEREITRCVHHRRPLSLVMLDLDHFKDLNDKQGYLTGDHVLRELARRLAANVRPEEVLARYGGEEFAVILPETDLQGAVAFAEKARGLIADQPFEFEGDTMTVTISLGIATLEREVDAVAFVKIADDNLYRAKREGRNRVVGGGAGEWSRWKPSPTFRSRVSDKTALLALSLLARDQLLASDGGAARVDDIEGTLHTQLRRNAEGVGFGALEGGGKLLVSLEGRTPVHRLRVLVFEALQRLAEQRPDAQFAVGPVKLATNREKAIEDAVAGLDDEIAILENGRYIPQPVAIAMRATDGVTNAGAKFVLELGETVLQWLSLTAAADLFANGDGTRTIAALKRHLASGVTMGRWHEVFVTAVKELIEESSTPHRAAWQTCFGDKAARSETFSWLGSLVELRNAFAHGATASDEHLARKLVDQVGPRLRTVVRRDLRSVLALIPADVELLGFEGELQSYRLTRLIGDGIPGSVAMYSRRRMNPGLWLCDAIADRAVPLEPFFVRDTCPKCGARELFLLTRLGELEYRNPATGHLLKKSLDELPLSAESRERVLELTS